MSTTTSLKTGKVLVTGDNNNGEYLSTSELYNPVLVAGSHSSILELQFLKNFLMKFMNQTYTTFAYCFIFFFIPKSYINNLSVFIFILKTEMKIIHRSIHTRRLSTRTRSSSKFYPKKINSSRTIHVVTRQSKHSKKKTTTTSSTNSSKSELVSHHCASTVRLSEWPDWTTFEKGHREHEIPKRKKKLVIFILSYI
mgnify:CR=1 FL=1